MLRGSPRTCIVGFGFSGNFLNGHVLTIKTPCDWNWDKVKCENQEKNPRITWKGKKAPADMNQDGILIKSTTNKHGPRVDVELPWGLKVNAQFGGKWKGKAYSQTYFNGGIMMAQNRGGSQCGHCGNFNNNFDDDMIYDYFGKLMGTSSGFCQAACPK